MHYPHASPPHSTPCTQAIVDLEPTPRVISLNPTSIEMVLQDCIQVRYSTPTPVQYFTPITIFHCLNIQGLVLEA